MDVCMYVCVLNVMLYDYMRTYLEEFGTEESNWKIYFARKNRCSRLDLSRYPAPFLDTPISNVHTFQCKQMSSKFPW